MWLAGLLLVAALLRFPFLASVPPGFQFDETYNAWDALRVVDGSRPIFLTANAGREPLYTYWQALLVARWGPTPTAVRVSSALPGIATILLLYGFVRLVFPDEGTEVAGLAAMALALSYWHLHFSRYGIRSILIPLLELPTLAALWIGIQRRGLVWFALCGVGLASMIWTHPVGRLMPVIVVLAALFAMWSHRQYAPQYVAGLAVTALVTAILVTPLGHYFWQHREQLWSHVADVSLLDPRVHQGSPLRRLALNMCKVLGMFTFAGDGEWLHNLPGRPVFDPLMGTAFLGGLLVSAGRLRARWAQPSISARAVLVGVWFVLLLLASVLSDMAPNFSRTIGVAPVAMLIAARGVVAGARWLGHRRSPTLRVGLIMVVMLGSGVWTCWDYFVRFARDPLTHYHYDGDKVDVAAFLRQESAHSTSFLAPLWAQHPTVSLLTRDIGIRAVDTKAAVVLPARDGNKAVLYAFPPEQAERAAELERIWGSWGRRDVLYDARGSVLLHLFRIPAEYRPAAGVGQAFVAGSQLPIGLLVGPSTQFGQSIRFLGSDAIGELRGQTELQITLVWEAMSASQRDYTIFIHLVDSDGRRWAQSDSQPGQGSYPTSVWRGGDVIFDHHSMSLDPCMPSGEYRLLVGWYDSSSAQHLRTETGGLALRLGPAQVISVPSVGPGELPPAAVEVDGPLGNGISLVGYDLPEPPAEVGRPFLVSLRWLATGHVLQELTCQLQLIGADDGVVELATFPAGGDPDSVWTLGQARCQTMRVSVPPTPQGDYRLRLQALGSPSAAWVDMGSLRVTPSQRTFAAPRMAVAIDQDLGGVVRLLGCDLPGASGESGGALLAHRGEPFTLTLYWRALQPMDISYTVFAHLLDDTGQLQAQNDSVPVNGTYPTGQWEQGEVVADAHEVLVPGDVPAGNYGVEVGLYDPITGERLHLTRDGQEMSDTRIRVPIHVVVR